MDDEVQRRQDHVRPLGRQHDETIRVGGQACQRGEIVGPVDRRPVVDVVGAGNEDRPDRAVGQALDLGGNPFDRPARLGVRIEEVAGDEEEVHLLGQGQVHGGPEGGELALALRSGLLAEVGVAGPEVNVGRVEQAQHACPL